MTESPRRLSDQVASFLRSRIYRGDYRPGQRLLELDLCKELGVSRSPLREALLSLQREGLVEVQPHRGASVAAFSEDDVREIAELRAVLEGLAARLVAERVDRGELDKVRGALDEMRQAAERGDSVAAAVAHIEFHRSIGRAAGIRRLVDFLDQLAVQSLALHGYADLSPAELMDLTASHAPLITVIESGDGRAAEEALVAHIKGFSEPIKRYLERARKDAGAPRRRAGRGRS